MLSRSWNISSSPNREEVLQPLEQWGICPLKLAELHHLYVGCVWNWHGLEYEFKWLYFLIYLIYDWNQKKNIYIYMCLNIRKNKDWILDDWDRPILLWIQMGNETLSNPTIKIWVTHFHYHFRIQFFPTKDVLYQPTIKAHPQNIIKKD